MRIKFTDSFALGTLYGSDPARALFDDRAWFQRMLDVEAALARTASPALVSLLNQVSQFFGDAKVTAAQLAALRAACTQVRQLSLVGGGSLPRRAPPRRHRHIDDRPGRNHRPRWHS